MLNNQNISLNSKVKLIKPLGFNDYIRLQKDAKAVLSDSGTISEETSILKLKSVNIREAHERPEAMEEGTVIMSGLEVNTVLTALKTLEKNVLEDTEIVNDYNVRNVSDKVLKIIISYTHYVNQFVWRKN